MDCSKPPPHYAPSFSHRSRKVIVERRGGNSRERGVAVMEAAVTLPFIVLLITAMIDTAGLLSQYVVVSNAIHVGLRAASSQPNLEPGLEFRAQSAGQGGCAKVGNGALHGEVQALVVDLIEERSRWIKPDSLCVTSGALSGGLAAGTPQENTTFVRVSARYNGLFPFLEQFEFTVESSAPML